MKRLTAYQLGVYHARLRRSADDSYYKTQRSRRLYAQGYAEGLKHPSLGPVLAAIR
jgi:hypothetical protein